MSLFQLLSLFLTVQSAIAAQAQFKPNFDRRNSSSPLLDSLNARDLFERQGCDAGYSICGDGCIITGDTCCDSGACPPNNGCCPAGGCKPQGWDCCGSDGNIYPLDGSQCCSDGSHCPPGSSCVACTDGTPGDCCQGAGSDHTDPTFSTGLGSATAPPGAGTTSYTTEFNTYLSYTYYYYTYTYYYFSFSPSYTPTTSTTVTTTTTISAYASDSADAQSSFAEATSEIQSEVTYSSSLYGSLVTDLGSAMSVLSSLGVTLPTVAGGPSASGAAAAAGGGGGHAAAASSVRVNLIGMAFGLVSVVVGMLAVML